MNPDTRSRLHRRAHGGDSGAMSGHARQVAPLGPAPVAVHDDSDVFWEPPWIQMPVDFRFLAIQPRGNFVLQSDPLRLEANTAGSGGAMCREVWPRRGGRALPPAKSQGGVFPCPRA